MQISINQEWEHAVVIKYYTRSKGSLENILGKIVTDKKQSKSCR